MERNTSLVGVAGLGTLFALFVAAPRAKNPPEPTTSARSAELATPFCRVAGDPGAGPTDKTPECETGSSLLRAFLGPNATRETPPFDLDVLIAVLPDPVESHLDWAFDSGVEAIRRGFERTNFVVDRYWLPWSLAGDSSYARAATLRRMREEYPGVLLFRSTDSLKALKVVLVVGETPTGGIHKDAMARAIAEHDTLLGGGEFDLVVRKSPDALRRLRIIGPVFSGSSVSLRRALRPWVAASAPEAPRMARIVSGGATLVGNRAALTCGDTSRPKVSPKGADDCWPGAIVFTATINPDAQLMDVFQRRVRQVLRIDARRVALLREGTTQYGQQVANAKADTLHPAASPDTAPLLVPFPMNISNLRSEYARVSVTSADVPPAPGPASAVRMTLKDPSSTTEGPPALSNLTAPSIDIELDHIAQVLVAHRISVLGILATDVRDRIFLASEMKKRMRDVQLVLLGSNVLYLRPDFNDYLRGMLVITTYPLFFENQWWDHASDSAKATEKVPFTSDIAEGTFNATVVQLERKQSMIEYDTPLDSGKIGRPPVWITVVGRGVFMPVVYDTGSAKTAGYLEPRTDVQVHASIEPDRGGEFAVLAGLIVIAFILSFLVIQIRTDAQVRERISVAKKIRRELTRPGRTSASERLGELQRVTYRATLLLHREFYQLLRFAALCGVFVPVGLVGLRVRAHGGPFPTWAWVLLIPAVVAAGLIVVVGVLQISYLWRIDLGTAWEYAFRWDAKRWRTSWRFGLIWWLEIVARGVILAMGTAYIAWLILFTIQVTRLTDLAPLFFARALQLGSGVSPVIPLAIGGVLLAAWSSWHLSRIRMLSGTTAFEEACMRDMPLTEKKRIQLRSRGDVRQVAQLAQAYARVLRTKMAPVRAARRSAAAAKAAARTTGGHVSNETVTETATRTGGFGPYNAVTSRSSSAASRGVAGQVVAGSLQVVAGVYGSVAGGMTELGARAHEPRSAAKCVRQIRERLMLIVPDANGVLLALVLGVLGLWLNIRFGRTIESLVFTSTAPSAGAASLSVFDKLFRTVVMSALAFIAWALYRLSAVWGSLRECLNQVADTPLAEAFTRLSPRVSRLTRLSPFHTPSFVIDEVISEQWTTLSRASTTEAPNYSPATADTIRKVMDAGPPLLSWSQFANPRLGDRFVRLYQTMSAFWAMEPEAIAQGDAAPGWVKEAETLVAMYVIEYIEWVFRHLQQLAVFLLGTLVLTTLLLASYPFQAQSLMQLVFLVEMVGAVVVFISILAQMNRNEVLSRIAGTDPGRITWSWSFVSNIALYGATPLITLISWEFPSIREILFSWVTPAFHMLVK